MKRFFKSAVQDLSKAGPWLVVLLLLAGPLGPFVHPHLPESADCAAACPCEAAPADHCCGDHGTTARGESPDSDPCHDGCPSCHCCTGLVMGLLPPANPMPPLAAVAAAPAPLPDAPVYGHRADVFRPPRALV